MILMATCGIKSISLKKMINAKIQQFILKIQQVILKIQQVILKIQQVILKILRQSSVTVSALKAMFIPRS